MDYLNNLPFEIYAPLWTLITACCYSLMCALLGVWLVLQRLSLLGDAISHSVLPGLILVFIFFGTRAPLPMAIGAGIAGLMAVFLMRGISKFLSIREDASIGTVFMILFAIGVILIARYARQIDLDPACVLYGLIEFVTLDTAHIGGLEVPRVLITLLPTLLLSLFFLIFFKKELKIMAFDPALASTLGTKPNRIFYGLMAIVAIATVTSFEAIGSILVIAMLIGPAATAQLLTRKLKNLFLVSALLAIMASNLGYFLAHLWNTSISGMISVMLGVFYFMSVVYTRLEIKLHHKRRVKCNFGSPDGI